MTSGRRSSIAPDAIGDAAAAAEHKRRKRSAVDAGQKGARRRSERGSRHSSAGRSRLSSGKSSRAHSMMNAMAEEHGDTEAADASAIATILDDKDTLNRWETAWLFFLGEGAPLDKNISNFVAFRNWCAECNITTDPAIDQNQADIDAAMVTSTIETVLRQPLMGEDLPVADLIDFQVFVRGLCHIGFQKYGTGKDSHELVLGGLLQDYVMPWVERHRALHDTDGIRPAVNGLHSEEVDRLLYVYFTPMLNVFKRVLPAEEGGEGVAAATGDMPSPAPTPPPRALGHRPQMNFEQFRDVLTALALDVPMEEAEQIMTLAAEANSTDVRPPVSVDVTPVQTALQDNTGNGSVNKKAADGEEDGAKAHSPRSAEGGGDGDAAADADATSSHGGSARGDEGDAGSGDGSPPGSPVAAVDPHVHLRLDEHGFMEALLRVSQYIATRTEHDRKTIPTITARFQAFLAKLRSRYEVFFKHGIDEDCDWEPKGVPSLAHKGVFPSTGPPSLGKIYDITINGSNFCTKRGVYVRFIHSDGGPGGGAAAPAVVKAHTVRSQKITACVPEVNPKDVVVEAFCDQGTQIWCVNIARMTTCQLEASNDGHAWSASVPRLEYTFAEKLPSWFLPEELGAQLHAAFTKIVTFRDKRNTRFMTLEKWRRFKSDYGIEENSPGGAPPRAAVHAQQNTTGKTATAGGAAGLLVDEPFFQQLSMTQVLPPLSTDTENHGVRTEACLDMKAFLKMLCKCLCFQTGADGVTTFESPGPRIAQLLLDVIEKESKRVEISMDDILDELNTTREAIATIEHKGTRVLDVYLGAVLCANIVDHPGFISMSTDGAQKKKHKALTCTIYDTANEKVICSHVMLCDTFDQLYHRLANASFDFASPTDPSTRKPTGRCWQVYNNETKIGVMWDYAGNFSNHLWQPTQLDAYNGKLTMTVYKDHEDIDFIVPFMQFMKADTPQKMRKLLVQRGYTLRSCLYKKV